MALGRRLLLRSVVPSAGRRWWSSVAEEVVVLAGGSAVGLVGDAMGTPGLDVVDLAAVGGDVAGVVVAELVADLDEVAEGAGEGAPVADADDALRGAVEEVALEVGA